MQMDDPGQYRDPARFEEAIAGYERQTARNRPAPGGVLGYGSSSIRLWRSHWGEDLAPLTMVGRGFGGSNMNDALYFAARLVLPLRPRAILFYSGDNDLTTDRVVPEEVADKLALLIKRVGASLPAVRWYVLSIKPSIAHAELWLRVDHTNSLLETVCANHPKLTYLDMTEAMRDGQGQLRPELYADDRHHLSREGYRAWAAALRPVLVERERLYE